MSVHSDKGQNSRSVDSWGSVVDSSQVVDSAVHLVNSIPHLMSILVESSVVFATQSSGSVHVPVVFSA